MSARTTLAIDVLLPLAIYYALRAAGASIYMALLVGAVIPAANTSLRLIVRRRVDRLGAYVLSTMLLGVGVSLIAGSPRFLLAKESWVTAVSGAWFLVSARGEQPLSLLFSRILLEGRSWSAVPWDSLWNDSERFRRMWRRSSVIWGCGLLIDALARFTIAFTLPVDLVPALSTALFAVSMVLLSLIDQINFQRSGFRALVLGRTPQCSG